MTTETKTRARPAAVMLTPSAEARIAHLMQQAPADAIGVKLSTPRRGCSGLAYSVDYVSEANSFDERIDAPGGTLFIDGRRFCTLSARQWTGKKMTSPLGSSSTTQMPRAVADAERALQYDQKTPDYHPYVRLSDIGSRPCLRQSG
jgi:Fe-S cluster assembly iron-binding protein IscA